MTQATATLHERVPEHAVDPQFTRRWSPRSFSTQPVPRATLDAMLEAARWAPSSMNEQPWTFHTTLDPQVRAAWNEAVNGFNRAWSDAAPVLTWVVARKTFAPNPRIPPGKLNTHAWFDTGAAAMSYVLEGERHGIKSHYLGGIDAQRAHALLGLDAEQEVICAIVSGFPGDRDQLPEALRSRETPSPRKPIADIAKVHTA